MKKRERLSKLDFFCLDNSIRESTVGQIRSHTLQNKIDILRHVKKCGIKDIVASFTSTCGVDDEFVKYMKTTGETSIPSLRYRREEWSTVGMK